MSIYRSKIYSYQSGQIHFKKKVKVSIELSCLYHLFRCILEYFLNLNLNQKCLFISWLLVFNLCLLSIGYLSVIYITYEYVNRKNFCWPFCFYKNKEIANILDKHFVHKMQRTKTLYLQPSSSNINFLKYFIKIKQKCLKIQSI